MSEPKKIDYKKVFEACNVELREGSGTQLRGDCPFCEKRNYLFVDPDSGKWDCKKCLETGNVYTFIRQWHNLTVDDRDVKALAKVRPGIGSRTLEQSRIGYDAVTDSWIIPSYMVKDGKYKVRSLRRWTADPKEIHSFPQLKCGIYIAHWSEDPNSNVWVLEGEWDAEAFHRLMEYVGFDDTVIGLPGAGSFPKEDLTWVEGRSVRLIYDNDSPIVRKNKTIRPGYDGMNRAIDKFRELGVVQLMVCGWGDLPAPIDVRDLCVKYFKEPSTAWNTINEMLETPETFRIKQGYGASSSSAESDEPLPESIDSFEQVMEEYGRVYEITDMFERCIACAFACIVSNRLPGDQLWMFLVGPPSCLAGDNKVIINRAGKSYPITLEELYHKFNNTGMYNGEWREDIPTTIQHRDDHGCVRLIEVRDVMFSGEKCIYELTTKTGRVIRASEDHRFLTPDGWRRLKQLQVGGYVLSTQGRVDIHREKQWAPKYKQVVGLKYHPNANTRNPRIISDGFKVVQHRLVVEADMNNLSYEDYLHILRYDQETANTLEYLPKSVHVHHKDRCKVNNDLDNLEVVIPSDHYKLHCHEDHQKNHVLEKVRQDEIVSIVKQKVEPVYDISVDAPHNFICEGIVVHNSGKTVIIEAFNTATKYTRHLSKMTSQNLVSGMARGSDPSVLPQLRDKCLFVKDFTAVLALPSGVQEELFGLLRDAYDRNVRVTYGNGTSRVYKDLNFTLFAGCTDEIYTKNHSALGERFLKIEILDHTFSPAMQARAALLGLNREVELDDLKKTVYGYCRQLWEVPITHTQVESDDIDWLVSVASIVAYLRTAVKKTEGNMSYRPRPEVPARLATQLRKLYLSLKLVCPNKPKEWLKFTVEKVAMDSCIGWALEFVVPIIKRKTGITTQEIAEMQQVAPNHVKKVLTDLQEIGVVQAEMGSNNTGRPGRMSNYWVPDPQFYELWTQAGISIQATKKFTPSRMAKRGKK